MRLFITRRLWLGSSTLSLSLLSFICCGQCLGLAKLCFCRIGEQSFAKIDRVHPIPYRPRLELGLSPFYSASFHFILHQNRPTYPHYSAFHHGHLSDLSESSATRPPFRSTSQHQRSGAGACYNSTQDGGR